MKATQILYLVIFVGIIYWILTSTQLLDSVKEGFQNLSLASEPVIPKGLTPTSLKMEASPNPSDLGKLPFGEYAQMASTGSFQYKEPSLLPADLSQMKKLNEDLRSFLVFEGVNLADSSDPTIQLPLTQLRADSQKLLAEISVLDNNPGIDSQLTQQDLANIESALTFLQRKVRLFQTAGVVSKEGFTGSSDGVVKTRATTNGLVSLQQRIYSAILVLSASGTTDPVVQSRIVSLQTMYSDISDMITKLNNGTMSQSDIPLYDEDIAKVLPSLAKPNESIGNLFNQSSGQNFNPIEKQIAKLVGEENAKSVFKNIKDNGTFRMNLELGYNTAKDTQSGSGPRGPRGPKGPRGPRGYSFSVGDEGGAQPMDMDCAYDTATQGMDDRAESSKSSVSRFDWKKRVRSICEQVRLRGLNPEDYGCIPSGTAVSPAYSWRGHAKMVCTRLGATTDSSLPETCGCPPNNWKGWSLSL
jgi:hypothetical protein